jgi:hypothetical protein
MTRTVTGLFDSYDDAAQAVRSLEDAGISYRDISFVSNNAGNPQIISMGTTDDAAEGAGAGAAVGAALGGGAGLLAGLGLVTIPGLGPMVAAGWLAATALGAGVGATTGGIIGALTGAGLSDDDAHVYAEGLRRGGTLVTARVADSQHAAARSIFTEGRAVDIAARAKVYRESGWTRFGNAAGPEAAEGNVRERTDEPRKMAEMTKDRTASSKPLIASDRVEGTAVYDPNGKHIGTVKRMMIEKVSGRVAYVVMSFGGFLGVGGDTYILPWDTLKYDTSMEGYRTAITEEQVRGAPTFYQKADYDWSDRERERELHDYYRAKYYWGG